MKPSVWGALLGGIVVVVSVATAAEYQVFDLGEVQPTAIDATGMVAATSTGLQEAVVITAQGGTIPLGFLPTQCASPCPQSSAALGIGAGMVVGRSTAGGNAAETHAFFWTAQTGMQDLGTIGFGVPAPTATWAAVDVNDTETVIGYGYNLGDLALHAVTWTNGSAAFFSREPAAGAFIHLTAINDAGDVVGWTESTPLEQALFWPANGGPGVFLLGGFWGPPTFAFGLNNVGQVVGQVNNQGFVWTAGTGLQPLPSLPQATMSVAVGVNDAGEIVGTSSGSTPRAVRWQQGVLADLNTRMAVPGWVLEHATAINNAGEIVGTGTWQGAPHGFRLVPLDDPPLALTLSDLQGDFDEDGRPDRVRLLADQTIWFLSGQPGATWQQIPGLLTSLVAGDFVGSGQVQLAGLSYNQFIWWCSTLGDWYEVPGMLTTMQVIPQGPGLPDALQGTAWNGTVWRANSLGDWQQVTPGAVAQR